MIRYDPHGERGHWHDRGYDKLGPGGSHVDFPEGLEDTKQQLSWSLTHIREKTQQLLEEAEYPTEAKSLDSQMLLAATNAIEAHLEAQGDLRSQAIEKGLLTA